MPIRKVGSDTPISETASSSRLDQCRGVEAGVDAHRDAERAARTARRRSDSSSVAGRRSHDQRLTGSAVPVAEAELALRGVADEVGELHGERLVEAELVAQRVALLLRGVLADHGVDRVADVVEQQEGR